MHVFLLVLYRTCKLDISANCDGSTYPQVLIYHKKPHSLLPWRKHELNFTGYSLPDLLVKGSSLKFATASNFLFDIGKGVETVDTKMGNFNRTPLITIVYISYL